MLDAVGSNIRVDARGAQVLRVLPRLNEDINEEWISDKTRFALDGLTHHRLDRPYVRRGGKLVEAEWREALDLVADRLRSVPGERVAAISGDLCDAEAMFALRELTAGLGSANLDCRQDGAAARWLLPRRLPVQHDDRRHRTGGSLLAGRHQSALGGAARQCAAAQALPARRLSGGGDRPSARL